MQTSTRVSLSTRLPRLERAPVEAEETPWKSLYRAGGVAALLSVALIPIAALIFLLWPPPSFQPTSRAVLDWFTLLQSNLFRGLLSFDLLFLVGEALLVPVLLALYAALRRASQGFMALALALGLIGVALYFSANPVFSLLALSNQYAAAPAAEQSQLVAAGQALLAIYQGTPFPRDAQRDCGR